MKETNTFILFWNPAISSWTMKRHKEAIDNECLYDFNWSVWEYEKVKEGDRFFMVRCGEGNTGICGSGTFSSEAYPDVDWAGKGREVYYADMDLDVIIAPDDCPVLKTETLMKEIPEFDWTGGHSGRVLAPELSERLEELWKRFLEENEEMFHRHALKYNLKDEDEEDEGDEEDDEYTKWEALVYLRIDGKIFINLEPEESWFTDDDSDAGIEAWTLDEAKSLLRKELKERGIDERDVSFVYECVSDRNQKNYEKALAIASAAHKGQTDKAGKPYMGHIARVSHKCKSDSAMIVALLHDTIEDTSVTAESLREQGIPEGIIKGVLSVTRREGESYEEFVKRAKKNKWGREVKIADLEDNMDIRRLEKLTDEDFLRLQKYLKAWKFLKE